MKGFWSLLYGCYECYVSDTINGATIGRLCTCPTCNISLTHQQLMIRRDHDHLVVCYVIIDRLIFVTCYTSPTPCKRPKQLQLKQSMPRVLRWSTSNVCAANLYWFFTNHDSFFFYILAHQSQQTRACFSISPTTSAFNMMSKSYVCHSKLSSSRVGKNAFTRWARRFREPGGLVGFHLILFFYD